MDKSLINQIIRKFLEGHCTDEEFAYLLYWYESFDEDLPLQLAEDEKESLRINILNRIKSNIPEIRPLGEHKGETKRSNNKILVRGWKYAAAAVFIGIIAWTGIILVRQRQAANNVATERKPMKEDGWITRSNLSDEVQFLVLPDSSRVWLNPGCRIHYQEASFNKERKVQLTGEAFFDVQHDAPHPFEVISQNLVTTVLGTSFLMKTNINGTGQVAVLSGKVAVEKRHQKSKRIILLAKQSVVLNTGNELVKEVDVEKQALQKWRKTNLSFNHVSIAQVIQTLDKRFGVQIFCQDDKIYHYQLNADFNNQNLADILEMLGMSLNINYKIINDSTISFYKKN